MQKYRNPAWMALMIVYLYFLVKIVLFKNAPIDLGFLARRLLAAAERPLGVLERIQAGNLVPFDSISSNAEHLSSTADRLNLFGNIALFAPLGFGIGLLTRGKSNSFAGAAVLSAAVSLALECSQALFSMGAFDVDDLILNGLGGVLGYAAHRFVRRPVPAEEETRRESRGRG